MQLRNLLVVAALVAFATPAFAAVKVYNGTPPNGTAGDQIAYGLALCPPVTVTEGSIGGLHVLTDNATGTVTMTDFLLTEIVYTNLVPPVLDGQFGPGAFVFVTATPSNTITTLPQVAPGSTAPGGTIAWGVIGGFLSTGTGFCISSPQTICNSGAMLPHGVSSALAPVNSTTYDLGTWSFDAEGDLSASQYINRTSNGGSSNGQRLIRGAYVGASVPALPLVGAAALALGLAIAGTRSVLRKK